MAVRCADCGRFCTTKYFYHIPDSSEGPEDNYYLCEEHK